MKNYYLPTNRHFSVPAKTITGCVLLALVLYGMPYFFEMIEMRKGTVINDWLLDNLPAYHVSAAIFFIIWGMGLLLLVRAFQTPLLFSRFVWAYLLICITRIITISLVPLAPPAAIIPLKDPLTGFFYGNQVITRDLFYSGHTATLFLIYLFLDKKTDKLLGLTALIILVVLLLVQHVHYTIDIVAAPLIVYPIYRFSMRFVTDKRS
jgi:hypothetical protein